MESVSIRDLKNQLSAYLRLVKTGTRVVVTDRGRAVAELGPVRDEEIPVEARLRKMAEAGEVVAPGGKGLSAFEPVPVKGKPVSRTILDEREERF
jgi:prevent-host-death family protein